MQHNEFRIKIPLHLKSSSNLGVLGSSLKTPTSTAYLSLDSFGIVFGWNVLGQLALILHGEACRRSLKTCFRPIDASQDVRVDCASCTQTRTVDDGPASCTSPAPETASTIDNEADVSPDISHFFIFHGNRTRRVLSAPARQTRRRDSPKHSTDKPICSQSRPVSGFRQNCLSNSTRQEVAVALSGCAASGTLGRAESLIVSQATELPGSLKDSKQHFLDKRSRSARLMELMCGSVAGPISPDAGEPALITDEIRLEVATAWNVPALYGTSSIQAEETTESVDVEVEALDRQSHIMHTLVVSIPNSSSRNVRIVPQCSTLRGRPDMPVAPQPASAACLMRPQQKPVSAGAKQPARSAMPPRCTSARAGSAGMYGACRGSESHHDSPQQPKVQGCRSGSPVEVFAEHLPDDSVWIVAKNATSLATPDSKSRNSLLRSFKSVAESLFERLRQSGGSECNDELETADRRLTRSRSPAQGPPAQRCQSARPCSISSGMDYSTKAAARLRPHTASHAHTRQRSSSPQDGTSVHRTLSADGCSLETWELRAERRMRVNALVQSVAKEKEQAEAGKLSQEQMQRFWQTNHRQTVSLSKPGPRAGKLLIRGCGPRERPASAQPAAHAEAPSPTKYPEHPFHFTLAPEQQQTLSADIFVTVYERASFVQRKGVHRPLRKYRNPDLWLLDATTGSPATAMRVETSTRQQLDLEIGTKRPQTPLVPKHKMPSRRLHRQYSALCSHNSLSLQIVETQLQKHRPNAQGSNEHELSGCLTSKPVSSRPSSAQASRSLERLSMLQNRRQQRAHVLKCGHLDL